MKRVTLILTVFMIMLFITGCGSNQSGANHKLTEYITIISYEKIAPNQVTIDYELNKPLEKGSGLTTQTIYFSNGKTDFPLKSNKKGKHKITLEKLENTAITVTFNGANQYKETMELN